MAILRREAAEGKQFDTLGLKAGTLKGLNAGSFKGVVYECDLARIVTVLPKGATTPLDLWGRVFQLFGKPTTGPRWNIYWFGATTPRRFPKAGTPLAAEHLNGGYTQICSTSGVFIYRMEEATRVLIHELLHAACLDPAHDHIPSREAVIETWAELILVALLGKGDEAATQRLWGIQAQWIADTNHRATTANRVRNAANYGWRYLNGREGIYASLGIALPAPSGRTPSQSRFTAPELGN